MKPFLGSLLVLVSLSTAVGQGTVNFINAGAPVSVWIWGSGLQLAGSSYWGQLYASPSSEDGSFVPVGSPASFRENAATGLPTGIVSGGVVTIPGSLIYAPGGGVWLQLRAWSKALGLSYESAAASGSVDYGWGVSQPFRLNATGNPSAVPPSVPVPLTGLMSFSCIPVPEPTPLALAWGGLALWASLRRRVRRH